MTVGRPARILVLLAGLGLAPLGLAALGCRGESGEDVRKEPAASEAPGTSDEREIEPVRLARAALAHSGIPLYPGAEGLDATEFKANAVPFVAVDFFSLDSPEQVVAFYDERVSDLTKRRNTTLEPGVVRYEFERPFSGLAVKPWDPAGADSLGLLARFDRRDAQGITSEQLDAYGDLLEKARTHIVVNVPRPEPGEADSARQAEVAERGAEVMPFDLDRTTHTFEPLPDGGVQTVTADDSGDLSQVGLIRLHVRQEAERFSRGDFSDPGRVHGHDMPGLAELRAGAKRIEVRYDSLPLGGRIRYRTADRVLVAAIHSWFRAQVSDHGAHARR